MVFLSPASGKSTWIKNQLKNSSGGIWCSRDKVRFSIISDDEEYFSHEDEVFNAWVSSIWEAIRNPDITDIYVDATHINDNSRKKILSRLPKKEFDLTYVVFKTPLETCIARNKMRTGRELVPEEAIRKMYNSFHFPREGKILVINEKGECEKDG